MREIRTSGSVGALGSNPQGDPTNLPNQTVNWTSRTRLSPSRYPRPSLVSGARIYGYAPFIGAMLASHIAALAWMGLRHLPRRPALLATTARRP